MNRLNWCAFAIFFYLTCLSASAAGAKESPDQFIVRITKQFAEGKCSADDLVKAVRITDTQLALKDISKQQRARYSLAKANFLLYQGHPEKALPLLKQIEVDYPGTDYSQAAKDLRVSAKDYSQGVRAKHLLDRSKWLEGIETKMKNGTLTRAESGEALKTMDELLAAPEIREIGIVADLLYWKAFLLFTQEDHEKSLLILSELIKRYPNDEVAEKAAAFGVIVKASADRKRMVKTLAIGNAFPDFSEKDMNGAALSISRFRGRVVLIDFWATWCGPCVSKVAALSQLYGNYHDRGFEIIGISLDEERDQLARFIKRRNMPWPQYFDGRGPKNLLAARYGITAIPTTYLISTTGVIIGKNLEGRELEAAITRALNK